MNLLIFDSCVDFLLVSFVLANAAMLTHAFLAVNLACVRYEQPPSCDQA